MSVPHIDLADVDLQRPLSGVFSFDVSPGDVIAGIPNDLIQIDNPSICTAWVSGNLQYHLALQIDDPTTKVRRVYSAVRRDHDSPWQMNSDVGTKLMTPTIDSAELVNKLNSAHVPALVVDMETDALSVNSVITSVGMAVGDLATGEVFTWLQVLVPSAGQENRVSDMETIKWWEKERRLNPLILETQQCVTQPMAHHVTGTLIQIEEFFATFGEAKNKVHVFANGPEFDTANLMSLFERYGSKVPWRHGNNQSIRTAVLFGRKLINFDTKYVIRPGLIPHFALHDALAEFYYASETYQALAAAINDSKTIVEVNLEGDTGQRT